jgi:hypothetical protein
VTGFKPVCTLLLPHQVMCLLFKMQLMLGARDLTGFKDKWVIKACPSHVVTEQVSMKLRSQELFPCGSILCCSLSWPLGNNRLQTLGACSKFYMFAPCCTAARIKSQLYCQASPPPLPTLGQAAVWGRVVPSLLATTQELSPLILGLAWGLHISTSHFWRCVW